MSIRILTYNVRMLGVPQKIKNKKRADAIMRRIRNRDPLPDIVVLTEVFTKKSLKILLQGRRSQTFFGRTGSREGGLENDGYSTTSRPGTLLNLRNGGVIIFSRHGFVDKETKTFDFQLGDLMDFSVNTWWSQFHQAKGIAYSAVDIRGTRYHIFGTHLQHGCEDPHLRVRREQLKDLGGFIKDKVGSSNDPVIVTGDFNIGPGQGSKCQRLDKSEIPEKIKMTDRSGIEGITVERLVMSPDCDTPEPSTIVSDEIDDDGYEDGETLDHFFAGNRPVDTDSSNIERLDWEGSWVGNGKMKGLNKEYEMQYFLSDHHPIQADLVFKAPAYFYPIDRESTVDFDLPGYMNIPDI